LNVDRTHVRPCGPARVKTTWCARGSGDLWVGRPRESLEKTRKSKQSDSHVKPFKSMEVGHRQDCKRKSMRSGLLNSARHLHARRKLHIKVLLRINPTAKPSMSKGSPG
jgi:hypothetical protein